MPNLVPWVNQNLHSYYHGKNQNYFGLLLNVRTVCFQRLNPEFRFNIFLVMGKASLLGHYQKREASVTHVRGKLNQGALQNIQTCQNFWNRWDESKKSQGRSIYKTKNWKITAEKLEIPCQKKQTKDTSLQWKTSLENGRPWHFWAGQIPLRTCHPNTLVN